MKIIISGGWGYGNLGDDAILDSTIQQLQMQYPGCQCVVLTYDLDDSAIHVTDDVSLRIGAHGLTDGGGCEIFRPSMIQDYSLPRKAWIKAKFALTETATWFKHASKAPALRELEAELATADLFVMAGGGYFNEKWLNKTRAQLLELRMATKAGLPTIILGPTIGLFEGNLRKQIEERFRSAQLITVRDEFSFAEATQWSQKVSVVPDIALSTWCPESTVQSGLGIVFTSANNEFSSRVAQAIRSFVDRANEDMPVKLFVTRRWKYDLRAAITLQEQIQSLGITCNLVMPSNFRDLEKGLASCQLVISENLHGLILAARNLVPVVAVNDYPPGSPNYKKFIAFLAQSNSQNLFFDANSKAEDISNIIWKLMCNHSKKKHDLQSLRKNVLQEYASILCTVSLLKTQ
jgi:polysaccharide pyruvyl transferase WcaK-like protein